MEIKKRLVILFLVICGAIYIVSSITIFLWFSKYRESDFYDRLERKARTIGQMLIDIDGIDANLLSKIEQRNALNLPYEQIKVFDENGKILYSNIKGAKSDNIHINSKLINELKNKNTIHFKENEFEGLGIIYKGKNQQVSVLILAVDVYGMKKLIKLKYILFFVTLLSIILSYIFARFYVRKFLKPISKVIEQVDNIGISNISSRVDEGNKRDEIAQLARTFNKMLSRLETAFNVQKKFIANASHELRNPLTVITGQLEVFRMKERTVEDYNKLINSLIEDINSLNQVAHKLLLLARASNELSESEFNLIRIDDAVWQSRQDILKRNPEYSINIIFNELFDDERLFVVSGNELLLKSAFANLIENGCKYSPDATVNINFRYNQNKIYISFINKGNGIDDDEKEMIFQPFYRGKNSSSIKGHGIGLSLVEKIIQLHKGTIDVKSIKHKETEFVISMPIYQKSIIN